MAVKKVLVQMGHVSPREPGFESGTGAGGEQELVKQIGPRLANLLNADPEFEAILVPGDIPDGVRVDAALFLHGDGSGNKDMRGFSYGYPEHPVNKKLRDLLYEEYVKIPGHPPFFRDNYTGALRGYYGYSRVASAGPEVLIEHGFLSNDKDREWMFSHVGEIARAHYDALRRYFGVIPKPKRTYWDIRIFGERRGQLVKRWPRATEPSKVLLEWNVAKNRPRRITIDRVES